MFLRGGSDVAALTIGYRSKNASAALRYLKAAPAPLFAHYAANFQLVVGLFLGAVGSALIYNLFIGIGAGYAFQRIYIVWCIFALMNGLLASGALNGLWPALAVRSESWRTSLCSPCCSLAGRGSSSRCSKTAYCPLC